MEHVLAGSVSLFNPTLRFIDRISNQKTLDFDWFILSQYVMVCQARIGLLIDLCS